MLSVSTTYVNQRAGRAQPQNAIHFGPELTAVAIDFEVNHLIQEGGTNICSVLMFLKIDRYFSLHTIAEA